MVIKEMVHGDGQQGDGHQGRGRERGCWWSASLVGSSDIPPLPE